MAWHENRDTIFVGGEWIASDATDRIAVISPFTEQVIGSVPSGTRGDIDRAVAAARKAFDEGPWPRLALSERMAVLRRLSDLLTEHRDAMADIITDEMGCPVTASRTGQVASPRMVIDSFLEIAPDYPFRAVRRSGGGNALVTRNPIGVAAAIVPWNFPLLVTMVKLTPALLAGCTVILKPAPETPFNAFFLAELMQAAGMPPGVVNMVPAGREVSEYLVTHRGVDKVSFTGSTGAGRRVASLCGQDLRHVTLELGGKSAAIVLDDADLAATVESLKVGSFRNAGQTCSAKTRIIVSRRREAELLDRFAAMLATMPVGDPHDPATEFGPLVSAVQRDRVEDYIAVGRAEGARLVTGGGRPAGLERGWFVTPTIFSGVTPDMRIAREEIFGPVLSVLTFDSEDEAVAIANHSDFGLNGSVFAADAAHGLEIAGRIHTGTVELNGSGVGFQAPIGGVKGSGIGRELGLEGFDAYVELKSIGLPPALADRLAPAVATAGT